MLDAERMKLVFRLGGIGFSLPVDHLVEIRQGPAGWLEPDPAARKTGLLGRFHQGKDSLSVLDLGRCLGLPPGPVPEPLTLLVVPGKNGPFGIVAERIEGFFKAEEFVPLGLPPLLQGRVPAVYNGFDLWRSELLIAGDAARWEVPA